MSGLGLFGTMEMARNSLNAQRTAAEVIGHNLANASNPAFARQRVKIESASTLPSPQGHQGLGAQVTSFEQIRDKTLDRYLITESSTTSYYESKLQSLNQAQVRLGQILERQTVDEKSGNSEQTGLSERFTDFFNTLQSMSIAPTSSTERQLAVFSGQELADRFNRAYSRLESLRTDINNEVTDTAAEVNRLLESISVISQRIGATEASETGMNNELRDQRQAWLEELAGYTNFTHVETSEGRLNLHVAGIDFIKDDTLVDRFVPITHPSPSTGQEGMIYIKAQNTGNLLNVTGGKIRGLIDARDKTIYTLRDEVDKVAASLITEINTLHKTGYNLSGTRDATLSFFTGTGAGNIGVNSALADDPHKIQASGFADAPGDNTVITSMAQLADKSITALKGLTLSESYHTGVAKFGQDISNTETQLQAQESVQRLLEKQRDSISGVSIDEEVAGLMIYQRGFQASARLLTVIDSLIEDVLSLQR